ncbi:MAG: hypothetical protein CH6_3709 [Candidatus Kapaibacterium sp.]|nr:MAG: hypothetical protein CH6_3709 [Candidatus Kapabacteria bacterium]
MKAVYIYPKSSFATELRSDTLWGLIIMAIGYVWSEQKLIEIINSFLYGETPFVLSSAFPFRKNSEGEIQHYLPRPFLKPMLNIKDDEIIDKRKKTKSIKFVIKPIFEKIINGEVDEKELIDFLYNNLDNLDFAIDPIKVSNLHTTIDPMTGTTLELEGRGQLFFTYEFFFHKNYEGLFFLIDGDDLSFIDPALRFLTHFGIGADHSIGKGHFDFEIKDFSFRLPENPNSFVTLSLYTPTEDELNTFIQNKGNLYYELVQRKGIIGSQFKKKAFEKKPFFAFSEGSRFPAVVPKKYLGRIIKTMDEPPAFSYSFAFPIPARFKE